jgi:thiamine biosynthesis lipoprotein
VSCVLPAPYPNKVSGTGVTLSLRSLRGFSISIPAKQSIFMIIKRLQGIIIAVFILALFCGCQSVNETKQSRIVMSTFCEISCFEKDTEKANKAMDIAFEEIERIEKIFSKFDENSEISKINKFAGVRSVEAGHEVLMLIEDSIYYSEISKGSFDITIGPLMEIWGFVRKTNSIPDKGLIQETLRHIGYNNIFISTQDSTIHFRDSLAKIDLGGIAKGYAVDRAKDVLVSRGIHTALINLAGNMYALGNPPDKDSWYIGIQDPRDKNKIIKKVKLKNQAISTSGDYERFFKIDGKRYSHIINPITGEPAKGIISVTVITDSAEEADALSTAIFVMGEEKGMELAKSLKNLQVFIIKEDSKIVKFP